MKDFSRKSFNLQGANAHLKMLYTFFLVFVLIGLATNVAYGVSRIGLTPGAVADYYAGPQGDGDDDDSMLFGKEFGELLNTTHFHAYIQGVVLLILTHLYVGAPGSYVVKTGVILAGFVSCLGDILTPWLVRYASGGFAPLMLLWWTGIFVSFLTMILVSLWAMWGPRSRSAAAASGAG
jgi:hypothetical protein